MTKITDERGVELAPASVRAEIERLTARLQTAERRIRSLASAEEPPTPADLEAIADLCRP